MNEDKLEILRHENNLNICIDFLARMIEKYGPELDICNIENQPSREEILYQKDGA